LPVPYGIHGGIKAFYKTDVRRGINVEYSAEFEEV
jgi:hypothetical protein